MDEYVKLKFLLVFSNIRLLYPCVFIGKLEKLIIKKLNLLQRTGDPTVVESSCHPTLCSTIKVLKRSVQ